MTTAPVLELLDGQETTQLEVHTDASAKAMGAVLLQKRIDSSSWHPVAYFSRKLSSAQQNYSTTDREMLAIVESLKNWRHYL